MNKTGSISWVGKGGVTAVKGVRGFVSKKKYEAGDYASSAYTNILEQIFKAASREVIESIANVANPVLTRFISKNVDTLSAKKGIGLKSLQTQIEARKASGEAIPQDTFNLHDSIGAAIFMDGGRLHTASSRMMAKRAQHWGDMILPNGKSIRRGAGFGKSYFADKIDDASFMDHGVEICLIAAIPYAEALEQGTTKNPYYVGWFTRLSDKFTDEVINAVGRKVGDQYGGHLYPVRLGKSTEINISSD